MSLETANPILHARNARVHFVFLSHSERQMCIELHNVGIKVQKYFCVTQNWLEGNFLLSESLQLAPEMTVDAMHQGPAQRDAQRPYALIHPIIVTPVSATIYFRGCQRRKQTYFPWRGTLSHERRGRWRRSRSGVISLFASAARKKIKPNPPRTITLNQRKRNVSLVWVSENGIKSWGSAAGYPTA